MLTYIHQNTLFHVKPENLHALKTKLEKLDKAAKKWKESVPKGEKRKFPKDSTALHSTYDYVRTYLLINNLNYRSENDDIRTGYTLTTDPTTWPEGEECIYTEDAE